MLDFVQIKLLNSLTLALDVIQILDSRNYFQSYLGKHSSLQPHTLSLSLGQ